MPIGKYEATNYCSMCDNQSASVKKCASVIERLQCCIAVIQTDITSNTFDIRIILFLYLMTNDFLL